MPFVSHVPPSPQITAMVWDMFVVMRKEREIYKMEHARKKVPATHT